MPKPYVPSVGSISSGTLRTEDLMTAFADELERIAPELSEIAEARAVATLANAGWLHVYESEEASDLVDALSDALSEHAPPFCYFGASDGDGADFGFWPSMESINELPCIADPSEVEGFGEECRFVNDHGNVTVYGADGTVLLDLV